jgi:hypothetical protein
MRSRPARSSRLLARAHAPVTRGYGTEEDASEGVVAGRRVTAGEARPDGRAEDPGAAPAGCGIGFRTEL